MDFAIDTNRLFVIKAKIVPVSTIILFGVRHQRRYFHSNVSDIKGKPKVVKDKRVYKSICNGRYSILKILDEGAMGATVYEMVSGQRPFEAMDLTVMKLAVENDEPKSLLDFFPENPDEKDDAKRLAIAKKRKIVAGIDAVVRKAMAKKKKTVFRQRASSPRR